MIQSFNFSVWKKISSIFFFLNPTTDIPRRPNGSGLNGLKLERRCHPRLIPASFNNSGIHRELDEACKHKCERDAWLVAAGRKGMEGDGKGSRGERERERESRVTCLVKQNISLRPMYSAAESLGGLSRSGVIFQREPSF